MRVKISLIPVLPFIALISIGCRILWIYANIKNKTENEKTNLQSRTIADKLLHRR